MKLKNIMVVSLLLVVLGGCGFHLRGAFIWPDNYQRIYISQGQSIAGSGHSFLAQQLKQRLLSSIAMSDSMSDADIVIQILSEDYQSRELASNAYGRHREYTYTYFAAIQVVDKNSDIIMPMQVFSRSRDYSHDESDLLGKAEEEKVLKREMVEEVSDMFMRRLSTALSEQ